MATSRMIKTIGRRFCGKYITATILIAGLAFIGCSPAQSQKSQTTQSNSPQLNGYRVVFADEFDALDLSPDGQGVHTWYEGVWYNQKHAPLHNISATGSILSLTWQRGQDAADTSITTLSRDARHFKAWRYGYFEARMRWDAVKGAWPAFWLIPVQNATEQDMYDGTRRSGEIDIFEGLGNHPHTFYGTIHEWINSKTDHASRDNTFQLPRDTDMSQYHTYGLLWVPGKVTWYFDNRPLHTEETPAIVDKQDFYIVLSMQEGQDWKYGDLSGVTAPSMTLNVDWVRVWQK